jgi:FkbM family methyltransferase
VMRRMINVLVGTRGDIRLIRIRESNRTYSCHVWDDSLWIAVKDNILLRDYERAGISLDTVRGTIIDAGAHVGLFSLRASTYAARVLALEPHPMNVALLRMNIMRNRLDNVRIIPKGLWSSRAPMRLYEGDHSADPSFVSESSSWHDVQCITLGDLIEEYGPVDLLKLDIEGAEFEVIREAKDASLRCIKTIVGELHLAHRREQEKELRNKLQANGFEVKILEPLLLFPSESIRRIVKAWSHLRANVRLKGTVLAAYVLEPLLMNLVGDKRRIEEEGLRYLFARRNASM